MAPARVAAAVLALVCLAMAVDAAPICTARDSKACSNEPGRELPVPATQSVMKPVFTSDELTSAMDNQTALIGTSVSAVLELGGVNVLDVNALKKYGDKYAAWIPAGYGNSDGSVNRLGAYNVYIRPVLHKPPVEFGFDDGSNAISIELSARFVNLTIATFGDGWTDLPLMLMFNNPKLLNASLVASSIPGLTWTWATPSVLAINIPAGTAPAGTKLAATFALPGYTCASAQLPAPVGNSMGWDPSCTPSAFGGYSCQPFCNAGYVPAADAAITCGPFGNRWVLGSGAACVKAESVTSVGGAADPKTSCAGLPAALEGGAWADCAGTKHGGFCFGQCNSPEFSGTPFSQCTESGWKPVFSGCVKGAVCQRRPSHVALTSGVWPVSCYDLPAGRACEAKCKNGAAVTIQCEADTSSPSGARWASAASGDC